MSEIITVEFSGEQDFGTITAEEMFTFMMNNGVKRFNSFYQIWIYWKKDEDGNKVEEEGIISEMESRNKDGWIGYPTNKWDIDIN